MKKIIQNTIMKKVLVMMAFMTGTLASIAQDAAPVVNEKVPVEDTRTIAEWSVFSGTQIFTLLMIIMIALIIAVFVLSDAIKNLLKSDKFRERMKSKTTKTLLMLVGFSLIGNYASAASPEANSIIQLSDSMFWALISVNVVLLLVVLYLANFMKWILREMNPEKAAEEALKETWLQKIMEKMTDAVPVEKEEAVLTDHEYDGIRELDNNLPPWWLYGFYMSIAFAFIYLLHFHIFKTGDLQAAEYDKEMKRAKEEVDAYLKNQADNVDEFTVTLLTDDASIAAGKAIYEEKRCEQCHGKSGEGSIGPNLTDDYWLHGGDIKHIFTTIKYGVQGKAMVSWKDQITPKQMHQLASYVMSLRGSKPAGAKAPEGELYSEEGSAAEPVVNEGATPADSTTVNDTTSVNE